MNLQESGEMYLETILILSQKQSQVRSIDIVEHMGYSKPSVSRAVHLLEEGNFIVIDRDGSIALTSSGKEVAEKIYERHTILSDILIRLGVDKENASADACKIEHVISDETFHALKEHALRYQENQTRE